MTIEQIKLLRLKQQYLLTSASAKAVIQNLCGLQAQFLTHALHSLSIRSEERNIDGLVKTWALRGTMHLFREEDLPLFLHERRTHFLRPIDTMETDEFAGAERKAYFADLIVDSIANGTNERESLKQLCREHGMTGREEESFFNPWGGLIRALCESGRICHEVREKKAYRLCPVFTPMQKEPAQLEMTRRYFTHYGPATVKDAANFIGFKQVEVRALLSKLPVTATTLGKEIYYHLGPCIPEGKIPRCLFLAGFDPLMLGYEKTQSLFLPRKFLRGIYTLSGIVRPAILTDGTVTGWWNYKKRILTITDLGGCDKHAIEETAAARFPDAKQIILK